jgi:hypothetical protein
MKILCGSGLARDEASPSAEYPSAKKKSPDQLDRGFFAFYSIIQSRKSDS